MLHVVRTVPMMSIVLEELFIRDVDNMGLLGQYKRFASQTAFSFHMGSQRQRVFLLFTLESADAWRMTKG